MARKTTSGVPGGEAGGDEKRGLESQPRPQLPPRAAPACAPAAPACRPEAPPLRVRLLPPPLPPPAGRRDRGFPCTCQVHGVGFRAVPYYVGFYPKPVASSWRVRLNGRALTPVPARPRPPGRGCPRGHLPPACKSHFSAFHLEQGREIRGPIHALPDRRGALLQVLPTPRWALGTAAGLARFPASLRQPQPCLPVLAVHTQKQQ